MSPPRVVYFCGLLFVLAAGTFLRLPPALFHQPGAPWRSIAWLHPRPGDMTGGFDERLYETYVEALSRTGLLGYDEVVERYREEQAMRTGSVVPPLRFLFVFAGYCWKTTFDGPALLALRNVASLFSVLTLICACIAATRLGGASYGLGVASLMAFAPTQLHMSQHALVDGFFSFWALLALWTLWENVRTPGDWRWLAAYALSLVALVLTKENAFFTWCAIAALLIANRWIRFGVVGRELLFATLIGPLLGLAILGGLAGGLSNLIATYQLSVSKNYTLDYAVLTGDGPWHRYLIDLLAVSPIVFLLAVGAVFSLGRANKIQWFCALFIGVSYAIMCNIKYGMNLRYANMWDFPLRVLSFSQLILLSGRLPRWRPAVLITATSGLCLVEFHQYLVLAVRYPLYELVTPALFYALKIFKSARALNYAFPY